MFKKRVNKSKGGIINDMKRQAEAKRQRKLVKDVLYPFLLANTKSIEDAKSLCMTATVAVQTEFNNQVGKVQQELSNKNLSELKLVEAIEDPKKYSREVDFITLLGDEKIHTAEALLKGLKTVIESFEREDSTKRPLSELKADLL